MKIREILSGKEDAILGNGVDREKIDQAEKSLGLSFAADYREYLATVGLAMVDGHEFTGIGKAERTNVVSVTKQMKTYKEGIPGDWYVIEDMYMDGAAIWQDSKGYIYFNSKKMYNSLSDFLIDL